MSSTDMASPLAGAEGAVSTTVGLRKIPPSIRRLDTFDTPDYADLYTLTTNRARDRSPEQWARALLEEGALARQSARRLWHTLGIRLGPAGSPEHVQGWKIADRGDDWIRAEALSWYMTGHALVVVGDDHVSVALFLRYDNRAISILVWALVGPGHRRAVPVMLRQALGLGER